MTGTSRPRQTMRHKCISAPSTRSGETLRAPRGHGPTSPRRAQRVYIRISTAFLFHPTIPILSTPATTAAFSDRRTKARIRRLANEGLGITEIEYLASDPNTWKWLMAGTQDNGTIRYTDSTVWDHIADGDGGDCGVNQLSPNVVYHSYYNVSLWSAPTIREIAGMLS